MKGKDSEPKRVLVFGGTTEGRLLAARLSALSLEYSFSCTVCVATGLGAEALSGIPGIRVLVGRKDRAGIEALCRVHTLCVDTSHPYAVLAHENIRLACRDAGIPYLRLLRPKTPLPASRIEGPAGKGGQEPFRDTGLSTPVTEGPRLLYPDSLKAAADYLMQQEGNILLTIGGKDLACFSAIPKERLYARILPMHASLSACEALGLPYSHILALQGPFTEKLNLAMLEQYRISWLVTKDGGKEGGLPEKLEAAKKTGTGVLLIPRPEEAGEDLESILQQIKEILAG